MWLVDNPMMCNAVGAIGDRQGGWSADAMVFEKVTYFGVHVDFLQ